MLKRLFAIVTMVAACTLPAAAGNNIVHFGSRIVVSETQSAGNIVCFLCSVQASGPVHGNIVVFGGNIFLHERADGNITIFGGNLWLDGEGAVAHNLVIFGGGVHGEETHSIGNERVILPLIIFLPVLLIFAAIFWGFLLLVRWLVRGRQVYYPLPPR